MPDSKQAAPPTKMILLQRRAKLLNRVREFFTTNGYWEVETPLLSRDTCIDRWLDPFELEISAERYFLQTSPEFAMKRLLCEGADSIFQVCKSFRDGEVGTNHNPEFTIIEWYRRDVPIADQITLVESLVTDLLRLSEEKGWIEKRNKPLHFSHLTYDAAFQKYASLSALTATMRELQAAAQSLGMQEDSTNQTDRDDLLNFILVSKVEPELAKLGAVSIVDYPASQAALAKIRAEANPVAERFEMYLEGQETCNGYQELTDPQELRQRMQSQNEKRTATGKRELPVESQLLRKMEQSPLPECSGVALGFDRLAMICLGQSSLKDVMAFPFDEA